MYNEKMEEKRNIKLQSVTKRYFLLKSRWFPVTLPNPAIQSINTWMKDKKKDDYEYNQPSFLPNIIANNYFSIEIML